MEIRDRLAGRTLTLVGLLGVNLLPVAGVLALGWNATAVLVLYWIEAGVVLVREAFEGLFAPLPTGPAGQSYLLPFAELQSKRGSVTPVEWLPPVYPRNVPVALNAIAFVGIFWPLVGVGLYSLGADGLLPPGAGLTVAVAVVGVVVRHAVTAVESLRTGRYEAESAHSMLSQRHAVGLLVLLGLGALLSNADGSGGVGVAFLLIVATKAAFDVYEFRAGSTDGDSGDDEPSLLGRLLDRVRADSVGEESPVEVPDGAPTARFSTDGRAVRLRAVALGVVYSVVPPVGLVLFGSAFLAWVLSGVATAVVVVVLVASASVVTRLLVEAVRFGHLEYRVYETDVVAYDRLLDAAQWRVPRREISEVTTGTGLLGRWIPRGTGTVRLDRRDGEAVRMAFLEDPERVSDALGRTFRP